MIKRLFRVVDAFCTKHGRSVRKYEEKELSLRIERLESRTMLSGTVMATLVGGDLFLDGDNFDNDIELEVFDDSLVLVGKNDTRINGEESSFVVAESAIEFSGKVTASFRDGNDRFVVRDGVSLKRRVLVFGGAGDDSVGIEDADLNRLVFFGGSGDDTLALRETEVESVLLFGGKGDDTVSILGSSIQRNLIAKTSGGDDSLLIRESTIGGHTVISTGHGNDNLVIERSDFNRPIAALTGQGDDFGVRLTP
jgi:hypothetical protein